MRRRCCRLAAGEASSWPASRVHPGTQSLGSADRQRGLWRCFAKPHCWSKSRTTVAAADTPGAGDAVVEEYAAAEASAWRRS